MFLCILFCFPLLYMFYFIPLHFVYFSSSASPGLFFLLAPQFRRQLSCGSNPPTPAESDLRHDVYRSNVDLATGSGAHARTSHPWLYSSPISSSWGCGVGGLTGLHFRLDHSRGPVIRRIRTSIASFLDHLIRRVALDRRHL